jgi:hypothetical protein
MGVVTSTFNRFSLGLGETTIYCAPLALLAHEDLLRSLSEIQEIRPSPLVSAIGGSAKSNSGILG